MPDTHPTLRLLTPADIPAAQRLRELAKWNQTDADWRNLLRFEPQGCFAAEMDGIVVGTATTTRYMPASGPGSFGWVGMVLVDPGYRRHGIGSTLLKRCIQYLKDCGVETVKLDATPMGKPVYEKLGFAAEYELERWEGIAAAQPEVSGVNVERLRESDLSAVSAFDAQLFGAQRGAVIEAWYRGWPEQAYVVRGGSGIQAFGLARRGTNFHQIGPIVGDATASAAVFARMLSELRGQSVIVDAVTSNGWARRLVESSGLKHQRPFLRMAFGKNSSPGDPQRTLAICCPEIG